MTRSVLTILAVLAAMTSGLSVAREAGGARPTMAPVAVAAGSTGEITDRGAGAPPVQATAAGVARKTAPRMTAKPAAPIGVRWLSDGSDGTVSVQVVAGVDYVGATVRVTVPGQGRPLTARLSAAAAGEAQVAEWTLAQPAAGPLRAMVEIDTGDRRMTRAVVSSASRGKPDRRSAPAGREGLRASAGEGETGPADSGGRSEHLIELPAQQSIRRQGE